MAQSKYMLASFALAPLQVRYGMELNFCFRCSLFLVQGEAGSESRHLVSNLFDVSSNSTVEEMNEKAAIRIPWGQGIVGYVAKSGQPVTIADCYADSRFNQEVDVMTGYRTRSMMCHPIKVLFYYYTT